MEVKDFCISQGLLWNTQDFFLIFVFRAFSILHFTTYVDNACVEKTTKFGELRKLLPTNDAQGNPTRGAAQARSRGPSPFRGRAHPRSRGGPRAAKMGTKICYQVVGLRKLLPTNLERSTRVPGLRSQFSLTESDVGNIVKSTHPKYHVQRSFR